MPACGGTAASPFLVSARVSIWATPQGLGESVVSRVASVYLLALGPVGRGDLRLRVTLLLWGRRAGRVRVGGPLLHPVIVVRLETRFVGPKGAHRGSIPPQRGEKGEGRCAGRAPQGVLGLPAVVVDRDPRVRRAAIDARRARLLLLRVAVMAAELVGARGVG